MRGVPEVMDTGTLSIRGTIVRLEGIQGERGTMARQLARFLRRREVICAPSDAPDVQRCRIGNYNLSAIILAAGGGTGNPGCVGGASGRRGSGALRPARGVAARAMKGVVMNGWRPSVQSSTLWSR